jgi:hypothetical protein
MFALTVAAPRWWRPGRHARPETRVPVESAAASAAGSVGSPPASAPHVVAPEPELPPLAARPRFEEPVYGTPRLAAPALSGAVVESDDYVVVDEPLVEPGPTLNPATPRVEDFAGAASDESADDPVAVDAPPSPVAESFASRPGDQSVVVRTTPAPPLPDRPAITVEAIQRAREALSLLVDQAQRRSEELAAAARTAMASAASANRAPRPSVDLAPLPPRVVVGSEHDRLAMVPTLADPGPEPELAVPQSAAPLAAVIPQPGPRLAPHLSAPPAPPALRHRPTALIRDLEALTPTTPAAGWADQVLAILDELSTQPLADAASTNAALAELRRLSSAGFNAALAVANPAEQSAWIRASRALDRRLPVWDALIAEELQPAPAHAATEANAAALLATLHDVAALTADAAEGPAWRQYLRLEELTGLASVGGEDYQEVRRAAARDVLLRIAAPSLTPAQRAFLNHPPLVALAQSLRPWASGEVALDALAELIEKYELHGALADAEAIAELRLRMKWSDDPRLTALADDLNRNYRNANLRIAIAAELFNRLIPPQEPIVASVNERIAGAEVHGRSRTETSVRLRLLPDTTEWRMGLEASGAIESRTYSDVGPARVRNASRMEYEASKLILLNRYGLHIAPAQVQVRGSNRLVGVESTLDPVPIVGSVVEDVIKRRHRENQPEAMAQVKARVRRQASQRMDREADGKLHDLEAKLTGGVMASLGRFALSPEPVDMSTTAERAVMRLRLAGEQHLGANTPRPSAPSDSLASVQLHQSALNNAICALGLEGRRLTLGELHTLLQEKFTNRADAPPADLPQKAIVEFARHDAVRILCHDDAVELVLSIVELRRGRDSIKHVTVHAFFRPVIHGLEVNFVRDGGLQFEGAHLRTGPRLVLHSVFGKLLRPDQQIPLLAAKLGEDARLDGLMVTQLVIDDGWLALSVGPATPDRTAWRTRGAAVMK